MKSFGYCKVKTHRVYLCRGLTRYLWFSRWFSRLIRVLFHYDARVRPSISGLRFGCYGAQETSWMTKTYLRTCLFIPLCMGTCYYNCPFWWLYTLMIVSVKLFRFLLYKNLLLSIIFCSAAIVRFWFVFSFFLPSLLLPLSSFFLTIGFFRHSIIWHVGQWRYLCQFSKVENSRSLHVVSKRWLAIVTTRNFRELKFDYLIVLNNNILVWIGITTQIVNIKFKLNKNDFVSSYIFLWKLK